MAHSLSWQVNMRRAVDDDREFELGQLSSEWRARRHLEAGGSSSWARGEENSPEEMLPISGVN
jgi:hypothetical protein